MLDRLCALLQDVSDQKRRAWQEELGQHWCGANDKGDDLWSFSNDVDCTTGGTSRHANGLLGFPERDTSSEPGENAIRRAGVQRNSANGKAGPCNTNQTLWWTSRLQHSLQDPHLKPCSGSPAGDFSSPHRPRASVKPPSWAEHNHGQYAARSSNPIES